MLKNLKFDPILLGAILFLLGFGVVVIYSSSGPYALNKGFPVNFYVVAHIKKVILGLVTLLIGMNLPTSFLKNMARPFFFFCLFLLIILLVGGVGITLNGATRWMSIGGFEFQPSELMKFATILMLAVKLEELKSVLHDFKQGFIKPLILVGIVFGLIVLQPNYSMASIILMISLVMMYTAGVKIKHMIRVALVGLPFLIIVAFSASYRLKRFQSLLNPTDNAGGSYQQTQSLISLGNGGLFGTGLGAGTQKLGFLPMPFTDMIYAMVGEELGFLGTATVLLLFGILILRGIQTAAKSPDVFSSLVAIGLTISVTLNVFLHIGVCTRILPPTGQPLPLISYGGSSLVMTLFSLGILLRLSGQAFFEKNSKADVGAWQ